MAFVASDWSITRSNGNIRYIGDDHEGSSPSYATVLELHRALQDFADDASYLNDDELDITDPNPSDKSFDTIINLINGHNIDDASSEHLYDGSIIQADGDEIYDGLQILAPAGTGVQFIQNGAVLSDDWWNMDGGLNVDSANGISHKFLLKVRTGGVDIDGRRLIATTREWGKNFLEFKVNGTSRGINVVALATADDLNNATSIGTIAAIADISNLSEGYVGLDVNNDTVDEFYYSEWDRGANSINTFYERMKWLTRDSSASTLYGLNGELFRGITHEITVDGGTGTWNAFEAVSWSGGTGQLLARNNATASSCTKLYIQLLTGVAPTDNQTITGGTSGATNLVNVTVTERPLATPFCGASTGSSLIGAYGFGVTELDLSASDKVFDLTNTLYEAPNLVTFTVGGLVSGDRVLVTNDQSSAPDFDQFTLNGTLSGAAVTSVVITGAIPVDTPATGTILITRNSGLRSAHPYSAWSGSTFTITSADFSSDNATTGNDTCIAYIFGTASGATMSFTSVYSADRTLFIRVRDGGVTPIKQFETTGVLGTSGGSTTAIRTSDA
jgi:hypothetical protein